MVGVKGTYLILLIFILFVFMLFYVLISLSLRATIHFHQPELIYDAKKSNPISMNPPLYFFTSMIITTK
jgi:hypothetical protein